MAAQSRKATNVYNTKKRLGPQGQRHSRIVSIILQTHKSIEDLEKSLPKLSPEGLNDLAKNNYLAWEAVYQSLYDEEGQYYKRPIYSERQVGDIDLLFYLAYKISKILPYLADNDLYPPLENAKTKSLKLFYDFDIKEYGDCIIWSWDKYYRTYIKRNE